MKQFNSFSSITRLFIIATIVLLFYGYLCRIAGLYFFWESKTIGWVLFWLAIIFILRDRIRYKKLQSKKTVLEKIIIGLSIFIIVIKGIVFFAIQQTTAYKIAVNFIKTNPAIQNKVGTVNSVFLMPYGSMSVTSGTEGSAGEADLYLVVKGSERYIDLNVWMAKDFETDWQIQINQ